MCFLVLEERRKDNVKRRLAVIFSVYVFHKYTRVYMKKLD